MVISCRTTVQYQQPEYWHWYNPLILFSFPKFSMFLCMCICIYFAPCHFFFFLGQHSWHMEVPRLRIESELQLWEQQCFNPLPQAWDQTWASTVTPAAAVSFLTHGTTVGTPQGLYTHPHHLHSSWLFPWCWGLSLLSCFQDFMDKIVIFFPLTLFYFRPFPSLPLKWFNL